MPFRISGLSPAPFEPLFGLTDDALRAQGVVRLEATPDTEYTDRIELRNAAPGETVLLLNHVSQPAATPYRASHAIFVREGASRPYESVDSVPASMRDYPQSLRGFSNDGMLVEADLAEGSAVAPTIERLFGNPAVDYILSYNAKQGCYAARVDRT